MEVLKNKRIRIGIIISLFIFLLLYLGISLFFLNRFYFGSTVSCISIAGETVDEVNEQIPAKIEQYTLEIKERGNNKEQIKGTDINLKYNSDGKVQDLKDKQNGFAWIIALFNKKDSKVTNAVSYDEKLLRQCVDSLACLDSKNVIDPKNPAFQYKENSYIIVSEVKGNKINKDDLYAKVVNSIINGDTVLDLEAIGCYINPQYNLNSKEVIDTRDMLNKYISSNITYTFGNEKEVLDSSTINKWIDVNEDLEITFNEKKIKEYLDDMGNKYDTVGKTRNFVTSVGNTIKVSGGDYGWIINEDEEVKNLISDIKKGQTITKEPIYKQAAVTHDNNDIGNTYVEINMTKQHLWFYKNGSLIVDGDVVTGNVSNHCSTPAGVYKLKDKERNAILKGEGYSTPVSFWMPFNGGIGIHDATWRAVFGGNIYMTNGSHGCVNAPYNLANTIFNNIDSGSPVVCYY